MFTRAAATSTVRLRTTELVSLHSTLISPELAASFASDIAATRNIGASELAFDPTYDPTVQSVGDFTDRMNLLWRLAMGT